MATRDQDIVEPGLQPYVELATADLATRLGVDPSDIVAVSAISTMWPNPALGCERPGMRYKQVPVDGSLIRLRAGGRLYRYHSGGSRTPFLCEQ